MAASFPPALRDNIALRNVEAAAALSAEARHTLAEAIEAGLKRIPAAIEILKNYPHASAKDLLDESYPGGAHARSRPGAFSPLALDTACQVGPSTLKNLADLIQTCYPDMPRVAADALAASDALRGIALIHEGHEAVFTSATSDFTVILFKSLLEQSLSRLSAIIQSNPAYLQAVRGTE